MTVPVERHSDGRNQAQLINYQINPQTTDPTVPAVITTRTDTGRIVHHDGTQVQEVAHLSDITAFQRFRGTWDATLGIPTAAASTQLPGDPIRAGDWWLVTNGGTIAGLNGADVLEALDHIYAEAANAAAANQFHGINQNVDTTTAAISEVLLLASLPAVTPTNVVATIMGNIDNFMVRDAAGKILNGTFDEDLTAPNTLTLESLSAYSNLTIHLTGRV